MGDRRENIKQAARMINLLKNTKVLKQSPLIQTDPVGCLPGQPKFLNGAFKIETRLSPLALLKGLKLIERKLGRVNSAPNSPRTIDLDILLYGDKVIRKDNLTVPHPRMFKRPFVTEPLSEII